MDPPSLTRTTIRTSTQYFGNAVILKPSEYTVFSSLYLSRIVHLTLALCGHDPELVQINFGGVDIDAAVVSDAGLGKPVFTRSMKLDRLVHDSSVATEEMLSA